MKQIPPPSRKRLVTLSQILAQHSSENGKITSIELSEISGWTEATIRRDISLLQLHSGKSNGYSIEELRNSIREKLNLTSPDSTIHKCCIVGLGKLGASLLENSIFASSNFKIAAGFDSNKNRTEILTSTIPLYSTSEMESVFKMEKIQYAILTVPDEKAQATAEKLAALGIKGIVNYTNIILRLPDTVDVENVNVLSALNNILSRQ